MAEFRADIRRWATVDDFAAHLARHDPAIAPWATSVCIHHTYTPTVAQWKGIKTLYGTRDYYIGLGWTSGPHLFICGDAANSNDRGIFQLTPLNLSGTHAGRCNADAWGVEVVGRYDQRPWSDATAELVYGATVALLRWRGLGADVTGHRECLPNKSCPGRAIDLDVVRAETARRLVLLADNDLTFVAPQRISVDTFARVLTDASSPAASAARVLADIPPRYGIDRGVALAFFQHESSFGKKGICFDYDTKNWGNVRRPYRLPAEIVIPPGRGPFARYASWEDGLTDWCERILGRYVGEGLGTVRKATPVYAPSSDGNRPSAYADAVVKAVRAWQRSEEATP